MKITTKEAIKVLSKALKNDNELFYGYQVKTIIIIIILILGFGSLFSQMYDDFKPYTISPNPNVYYYNGYWKETKCEICGKTVYEWIKDNDYYDFGITWENHSFCPGEQALHISKELDIVVCRDCYDKYNKEFSEAINNFYSDWLKKKKLENQEKRELFDKKRKQLKMEELKKQIKKLKSKLKELSRE